MAPSNKPSMSSDPPMRRQIVNRVILTSIETPWSSSRTLCFTLPTRCKNNGMSRCMYGEVGSMEADGQTNNWSRGCTVRVWCRLETRRCCCLCWSPARSWRLLEDEEDDGFPSIHLLASRCALPVLPTPTDSAALFYLQATPARPSPSSLASPCHKNRMFRCQFRIDLEHEDFSNSYVN